MTLTGNKTYIGIGFGAIQAGLFLYEACQSGHFGRLVVAEVMPEPVAALRRANGVYTSNIAHPDRIESAPIGPVQIENPAIDPDRERLLEAIAQAEEIGTAVPSVDFYVSPGPGSLHRLLADGLRRKAAQSGPPAVIYVAENHNHAAEILEAAVMRAIPANEQAEVRARVQFLNTVIGKMSGVVTDPEQIAAQNLAPVTPGSSRAFLVEAFNRILISQIRLPAAPDFQRGIAVFEEKVDLLPFEEAKLYGHNATHALAAYLGLAAHRRYIADLPPMPGAMAFLRAAFLEESGAALVKKYHGLDPLFTPDGYRHYVDDLLARMVNPNLQDTVERVGRGPERKLGWHDRLVGTMRLALSQGITPARYAVGAAAALAAIEPAILTAPAHIAPRLTGLWKANAPPPEEAVAIIGLIETGVRHLQRWQKSGFEAWPQVDDPPVSRP
jgi:mannitol-1-phosphate 5-dehydrogenase